MNFHKTRIGSNPVPISARATLLHPGPNDKVYTDSVLEIVVGLTLPGNDALPLLASAVLELSPDSSDYQIAGASLRAFVQETAPPNATATVTFYVWVPPVPSDDLKFQVVTARGSILTFTPVVGGPFTPESSAAFSVEYQDSDPLWLKTPGPVGEPPFMGPPGNSFAHYTATIKNAGVAVQDYVVEWRQVWDAAAFDAKYLDIYSGDTKNDLLTVDYLDSGLRKNGVVRSKTNALGRAEIYLVPKQHNDKPTGTYFQVRAAAQLSKPHDFEEVIVVGPPMLELGAPYLNILENDLDNVQGDFVFVGVSVPSNAALNDAIQYLLFLNGNLVAVQTLNIENLPIPSTFNIAVGKVAFKSTSDGSNGQNSFKYALASQRLGEMTSQMQVQTLSGGKGQNQPQPRDDRYLIAPWVYGAGASVYGNTIQNGLDCRFDTTGDIQYWPNPQPGDVATGTVYLNGWDVESGDQRQNTLPVDWGTLSQTDINNGYARKVLSKYLVRGYGSNPDFGTPATLAIDGYVQIQGAGQLIYTKINNYFLST